MDIETIYRIKRLAKDIFIGSNFVNVGNLVSVHNIDIFEGVFKIISDNGMIYLSTPGELIDRWDEIRGGDEFGFVDWILQISSNFRALGFVNHGEYIEWVHHLAESMSMHNVNPENSVLFKMDTSTYTLKTRIVADGGNSAINPELKERLPDKSEYVNLLADNLWFVYLLTLQLSVDEICEYVFQFTPIVAQKVKPKTKNA